MIASYLKRGNTQSNNRASYSSGSDASGSSSDSSSVLSFGSSGSAGSFTFEEENLGWKSRDRIYSANNANTVEDEDDDWRDKEYDEDLVGSNSDLSSDLLPRMSSLTFRSPEGSHDNSSRLSTPRAGLFPVRSPRHRAHRPGSIDTYSTTYDPALICSALPAACRSLDSQISALDRTCETLQFEDFAKARCIEKWASHTRNTMLSTDEEENAFETNQNTTNTWNKTDLNGKVSEEDEVEIVFDRSIDEKNEVGLWDGLMLWEVKAPGHGGASEDDKRRFRRTSSRAVDEYRASGRIVVFSPKEKKKSKRRKLVQKAPLNVVSILGTNNTSRRSVALPVANNETREDIDPLGVRSGYGHPFRSRRTKRDEFQAESATAVSGAGSYVDENVPKERAEKTPGSKEVIESFPGRCSAGSDEAAETKNFVPGISSSNLGKQATILKNPLVPIGIDKDLLLSSPMLSEEEQEPQLHIFLTRVPVYPETPTNEALQASSRAVDATNTTIQHRSPTDCATQKTLQENSKGPASPSVSKSWKDIFHDRVRNVTGMQIGIESEEIEIIREKVGGNSLSATNPLTATHDVKWGSSAALTSSTLSSPRGKDDKVHNGGKITRAQPIPVETPPDRDPNLYDSEGNTISPTTLKKIELAPRSARKGEALSGALKSLSSEMPSSKNKQEPMENSNERQVGMLPSVSGSGKEVVLQSKGGEKKVRRKFAMTSTKPLERTTSLSLKRTKPLSRRQRSDTEMLQKPSSRSAGHLEDHVISEVRRRILRRNGKLKVEQQKFPENLPHSGKGTKSTRSIYTSFSSNSILASSGESRESIHAVEPHVSKSEDVAATITDRMKPVAVNTSVLPANHSTSNSGPPIEFSPIDIPIVSKQICTADHLAREFVIQTSNQDRPVVLYPLLDFNPCYDVFIFPTDNEDRTFGGKQSSRLSGPGGIRDQRMKTTSPRKNCSDTTDIPSASPGLSRASGFINASTTQSELPARTSSNLSDGEFEDLLRSERHASSVSPQPASHSSPICSATPRDEEKVDNGIEVALAEVKRGIKSPFCKQLLGYVSHPRRSKRSAVLDDLNFEIPTECTKPPEEPSSCIYQTRKIVKESTSVEPFPSQSRDTEFDGPTLADGLDDENSVSPTMCQTMDVETSCNETLKVETKSLTSILPNPFSLLLAPLVTKDESEGDQPTEMQVQSPKQSRSGKHVTFRNWHLPAPFHTKTKPAVGELKSILRASNSLPIKGEGTRGSCPGETRSVRSQMTSSGKTPKISNRDEADPLSRKEKEMAESATLKSTSDERQPKSSIRCSILDQRPDHIDGQERGEDDHIRDRRKGWLGRQVTRVTSTGSSRSTEGVCSDVPSKVIIDDSASQKVGIKLWPSKATDTSTAGATAGLHSKEENHYSPPVSRREIPIKLPRTPLPSNSDDEYEFLDQYYPATRSRRSPHRDKTRASIQPKRSSSMERVTRWIGSMRPSLSAKPSGLSKRDRQKILKRHGKGGRQDETNLFGDIVPQSEKAVYTLLMEGNKSQADIYRTLTEIAIKRKKPHQSLAQAMNELEREVFEVYTEKCRMRRERKLSKRRDFDRRLMKAIQKKTERVVREENERARRQQVHCPQPSLFQDAIDFVSSLVVCADDTTPSRGRSRTASSRSNSKSRRRAHSSDTIDEALFRSILREQALARHHSSTY